MVAARLSLVPLVQLVSSVMRLEVVSYGIAIALPLSLFPRLLNGAVRLGYTHLVWFGVFCNH